MPLSIVFADTGGEFGQVARSIREADHPFIVRAETRSLSRALRVLRSIRADVLLIGMGWPDAETLDAIQAIAQQGRTRVVVMCHRSQPADVVAALEAGASEYLFADSSAKEVARVLTRAAAA